MNMIWMTLIFIIVVALAYLMYTGSDEPKPNPVAQPLPQSPYAGAGEDNMYEEVGDYSEEVQQEDE